MDTGKSPKFLEGDVIAFFIGIKQNIGILSAFNGIRASIREGVTVSKKEEHVDLFAGTGAFLDALFAWFPPRSCVHIMLQKSTSFFDSFGIQSRRAR